MVSPRAPVVRSSSARRGLHVVRIHLHLTGGDFLIAGAVKAQLADAYRLGTAAHRGAENAAGHGAGGVKVAGAGFRVKRRASRIVGKIGEAVFCLFAFLQHAGGWVSGEIGPEASDVIAGPLPYPKCARRIVPLQFPQAQAKALGIQRADMERAHASLRTSRTAHQPGAALARSLSQRGIYDLNQGPIADHASRIADNRDSGSRKNTVA